MTERLRCSVVIPTYNRVDLLRLTLDALARQTLPTAEFEVLIADDGSSDGTEQMVKEYDNRLNLRYLYQPDEGYRAAKARNLGISHASADILVMLDSGVIPHSGALAAHVASHEQADGPVAVCGYVFCFNEDNEDGALITSSLDPTDPDGAIAMMTERKQWLDIREEFYEKYGDDFSGLPAPWLVFWGCNVSARTEQVRRVGMYDEWFRTWGAEDVELAYRLFRDGAKFVLNRDAAAMHWPHEKSYAQNMEAVAGNYRYFAEKYGTPITQLVVDNHFFVINDIIRDRGLPSCEQFLAA